MYTNTYELLFPDYIGKHTFLFYTASQYLTCHLLPYYRTLDVNKNNNNEILTVMASYKIMVRAANLYDFYGLIILSPLNLEVKWSIYNDRWLSYLYSVFVSKQNYINVWVKRWTANTLLPLHYISCDVNMISIPWII